MFELIIFVIVLYVLFKVSSLQTQVTELRNRTGDAGPVIPKQNIAKPAVAPINISSLNTPQTAPVIAQTPSNSFDVIAWFQENWILKLGILMIVVGFGWFVSYAFVHNWIGPVGRITLGFVLGALVILLGDFRMKKIESQGAAFLVLGSAIILITVSAAQFIYEMFNPIVALSIVFITAAYITLASLRYDRKTLAIVGLIIAAIAPLLTNTPEADVIGRFLYIVIVTLSAIWVMFNKNWREVGATSALVVFFYSIAYGLYGNLGDSENIVLSIAYLLSLVFFVVNIISISKFKETASSADAFIAVINGILIILWTMSHVDAEWQSLMLAMWMIVFAIGSFSVFRYTKKIEFFYIYALTAVVYLVTATALELEGSALAFAYIFESAAISILGYLMTSNRKVGHALSFLMIGPAFLTLPSFSSIKWNHSFFHEDFALILCMGIVLLGVGLFYYVLNKTEHPDEKSGVEIRPYTAMIIIGSFYIYGLIWLTMSAIYDSALAVTISLAIYTLIGIVTYFFGRRNDRVVYKNYGAVMLLFVVGRLVLVDVWEMELALRIVTFILIGVLFVSTAFIANKNKVEVINN